MKRILGTTLIALALGGAAIDAEATPANAVATTVCSPQGKEITVKGKAATVYCGRAKVTVQVGSQTMTFRNGTCVWTDNSFKLQLGTIFLFRSKPLQQQPGFSIYATGYPLARALVGIYWRGTYYTATTLHGTARPSANQAGGTFTGRVGKAGTGPKLRGTVTCN